MDKDQTIPPILTPDLARRITAAERECYTEWVRAIADLPSNPLGAAVQQFGDATALVCREIPAQIWNQVFGLTMRNREHIPAILSLYRESGIAPVFNVDPFSVTPYYLGPNILQSLAHHGLYQGAFHQLLYGRPTQSVPALPTGISIREVGPDEAAAFGRVYEQVWGDATPIRVLLGAPRFRCYLAEVHGEAAALGVLHLASGVGSMANGLTAPPFRGRGCQTALLYRRIHDAHEAGCDLLVSQCAPGTTSERNQLRAGFRIAGSKVWWTPRSSGG